MGNRLCKKKYGDIVDSPKIKENTFDRIITRLHLRPNSWKSETQLNKHVNRSFKTSSRNFEKTKALSKSSDWVEASLEVPEKYSPVHVRNPNLTLIFNQKDAGTPTPPPRKHKKGIREKIGAAAKSSLQALQPKKPVDEPLCIKKKIDYECPCNRPNHKHNHSNHTELGRNNINNERPQLSSNMTQATQEFKRKKTLSVVSLPNYNDLKLSIATFDDIDRKSSDGKSIKSLHISPPEEVKRSVAKNYMIRCRSFGSLLPQQLLGKLKPSTHNPVDVESDDSFGHLEDWDLGLIEHYNPRDASLPRPRKQNAKNEKQNLSNIESLIIKEDKHDPSEPSVEEIPLVSNEKTEKIDDNIVGNSNPIVEHSSLMRILEEFSVKDKNKENSKKSKQLLEESPEKTNQSLEDFIESEQSNMSHSINNNNQ